MSGRGARRGTWFVCRNPGGRSEGMAGTAFEARHAGAPRWARNAERGCQNRLCRMGGPKPNPTRTMAESGFQRHRFLPCFSLPTPISSKRNENVYISPMEKLMKGQESVHTLLPTLHGRKRFTMLAVCINRWMIIKPMIGCRKTC